jgi:hypothetical protein
MKATRKSTGGTSFYNTTVTATVEQLRRILGEPVCEGNDGKDKTNFEWEMETSDGDVFTVYDWKEYRELSETEKIKWHIGGFNGNVTEQAKGEILAALDK